MREDPCEWTPVYLALGVMLVGVVLIIGLPGWLLLVIGWSWTSSGAVEEMQVGDDD